VLEQLIEQHGLKGRLLLKGAFCLETCQEGRSLKFRSRIYTGLDEERLIEIFEQEILPYVKTP
jgi:NADH:ubiquinone oxidoreductase subunit E